MSASTQLTEIVGMEGSAAYQAMFRRAHEEGRLQEARRWLLVIVGKARLGPPNAATRAVIEGINDVGQLEELAAQLLTVDSWEDLIPAKKLPRRRPRT